MQNIKTKTLITYLLGFIFLAYFGFWWLMATLLASYLAARALRATFRFTVWFIKGSLSLLTWRGRYSDNPFLKTPIIK